jgi:hypothetical protein
VVGLELFDEHTSKNSWHWPFNPFVEIIGGNVGSETKQRLFAQKFNGTN